jgi:sRNA-binding regulator protein Hfq
MAAQDHEGLNRFLNGLGKDKRITVETIGRDEKYIGELESNDLDVIVLRQDRTSILIRKDAIATLRHTPHQSLPMAY